MLTPGAVPGAVSGLGFSDSKWTRYGWTGPIRSLVNQPNQTKQRKDTREPERWHRKIAANVSMEVAANGPVEIVILPLLGTKEVA